MGNEVGNGMRKCRGVGNEGIIVWRKPKTKMGKGNDRK